MRIIHYFTIVVGLLIVLTGALLLPAIPVNNDIKSTFTEESQKQQAFDSLNALFRHRDEPVVISLRKEDGFTTYNDWKQLQSLTVMFREEFPEDSLVSILDITTSKKVGVSLFKKPLINLTGEDLNSEWKTRLSSYHYLSKDFVSSDLKQVNLFYYTDNWSKRKQGAIQFLLDDTLHQSTFDSYFLLSDRIVNDYIKERVVTDLYSLALYGFLIILALFYLFFRSWKIIVLIGVIAAINVNATIILMYWVGLDFNILTSIVPTIISILSVTDLNHIAYAAKEGEEVSVQLHRLPIVTALLQLKKTLIATSTTTAIGFAIFLFNDVSSVRVFALISILGIFISLLNVFIFAPPFYRWLAPKRLNNMSFAKLSAAVGHLVVNHYRLISMAFIAGLLVIGGACYYYLVVDYNPRNNLNKDSELYQHITQFDHSFQNTKVIEILASFDANTGMDSILPKLETLKQQLLSALPEAKVMGINQVIKEYNRAFHKGNEAYYVLPTKVDSLLASFLSKDSVVVPYFYQTVGNHFKLVVQMPYYNAAFTQQQLNSIKPFFKPITGEKWQIGSSDYFEDKSALGLVYSVLNGIFISIMLISLLTAVFFRNVSYFLPTLLVNLFPIVASLLLVSVFYGQITPSVVIILSIAFGIALDDTMYFVSKLKHVSRQSSFMELKTALLSNIESNTFPMVSTSVTLSGSFCALLLSSFEINIVNSFILISTLMIAMLSDLVILPALMLFFHGGKKEA